MPFDNPQVSHGQVIFHVEDCLAVLGAMPAKCSQTHITSHRHLLAYGTTPTTKSRAKALCRSSMIAGTDCRRHDG